MDVNEKHVHCLVIVTEVSKAPGLLPLSREQSPVRDQRQSFGAQSSETGPFPGLVSKHRGQNRQAL